MVIGCTYRRIYMLYPHKSTFCVLKNANLTNGEELAPLVSTKLMLSTYSIVWIRFDQDESGNMMRISSNKYVSLSLIHFLQTQKCKFQEWRGFSTSGFDQDDAKYKLYRSESARLGLKFKSDAHIGEFICIILTNSHFVYLKMQISRTGRSQHLWF